MGSWELDWVMLDVGEGRGGEGPGSCSKVSPGRVLRVQVGRLHYKHRDVRFSLSECCNTIATASGNVTSFFLVDLCIKKKWKKNIEKTPQ